MKIMQSRRRHYEGDSESERNTESVCVLRGSGSVTEMREKK